METYFLVCLDTYKEVDFMQRAQGSFSLLEYERKFEVLARLAPHIVYSDGHKAWHFETGLRPQLRPTMSMFELLTYTQVMEKAQILVESRDSSFDSNRETGKRPASSSDFQLQRQQNGPKRQCAYLVCPTCSKRHHEVCRVGLGMYYWCGKEGHMV
ncbi:hypothetical protein NE237_013084 [Protea cynaroides]|uniref:Retrotransposon gag domain-containing protein n=1 Tax=Protea cynaroides TaxID=273540 RepID=A0A9Q0GXZ7_9MAGN|nr:hypothetical protein NE237_013084 [Protea cynaroides]